MGLGLPEWVSLEMIRLIAAKEPSMGWAEKAVYGVQRISKAGPAASEAGMPGRTNGAVQMTDSE